MSNEFKSFYKTVGGAEGNKCYYPTRLDPYGKGCYYNCKYCYAKKLLNFRKLWLPQNVSVADITKIYEKIKKIPSGSVVRLGGMTDCFQPIEQEKMNTYRTIQLLNKRKIHYLIVTKSTLISTLRYMDILDKELAHIQVSIPTNNNAVLSDTDNADPFEERVKTVETLQSCGYDVTLRLSPFLYETCDYNELNKINVDKCLVEFLRLTPQIYEMIKDYVTFDDYTIKENGYRHLPLDKKLAVLKNLKFNEITVCDDVQSHYDYFKENFNHNPEDCCNLNIIQT